MNLKNQTEHHYRALEAMYAVAPLNDFYKPTLKVSEGESEIIIDVDQRLFHSAGAAHGSSYFKQLDDAAWFAVNSLEFDVFVLTTSFTTYITRPISSGQMIARGKVVNLNRSQWIAEAVVYDNEEREIARGNGIFVRSKVPLIKTSGYKDYCQTNRLLID